MQQRIIFIGPLRIGSLPTDGETAKNQILHEYLSWKYSNINAVDTYHWRHSIKVLIQLVYTIYLMNKNSIVISICTKSAYLLTKVFYLTGVRKNLHYFVIGNTIALGIERKIYNPKYYSIYSKIYVEGKSTRDKLKNYGLDNVVYLPNFKKISEELLSIEKKTIRNNEVIKFVFLSRITEDKGVSIIFEAIEKLNQKIGNKAVYTTIYEPI